jgi:DNA gyrase subunit B
MPELIERGHVYIAQPPLYKVKKGKQERYLKDDLELDHYVMELAIQDVTFELNGEIYGANRVSELAEQYLALNATTTRLSRRYDPIVLQAMGRVAPITRPDEANKNDLDQWVIETTAFLVERSDSTTSITGEVEYRTPDSWEICFNITTHGLPVEHRFNREFFSSSEYRRLSTMGEILDAQQPGLTVHRADHEYAVESLRQGFDRLLQDSKRLIHVQRYKGLGEMNPEQLWDTTMDAETRNLVQVQIEDGVAADQIFSTLMGDQVEPRRLFIEEHALSVTNVDT